MWIAVKLIRRSMETVFSTTSTASALLSGCIALWLLTLPSSAHGNAPNFVMLLGTSVAMIATLPLTVLIEAVAVKKISDYSWEKSGIVACVLYAASTSVGSLIGGGIMFAIHPIFFDAAKYFYEIVSAILFTTVNFSIEFLVLALILRSSLGWKGAGILLAANFITTAMLLFVAYSGLFGA
ncbi:hypothetical protein M1105_17150 [Limibaculum sp. FT325]|uniref:hypothetical protein n=1 Tax=Thermohalobaculum sediminis TaxID=2939436 RepID=UPI0020C127E4|nr:hypothetical protein [Limibaculum sediminis]MCL5778706.1 hypothetical protein [Limibaculum sediminis]